MGSLPLLLGLFNAPHTEGKLSFFESLHQIPLVRHHWTAFHAKKQSISFLIPSSHGPTCHYFDPHVQWLHTFTLHHSETCVAVIITRQRFLFVEELPSVIGRGTQAVISVSSQKFSPTPNTPLLQIANYISVNSERESYFFTETSSQIYNKS